MNIFNETKKLVQIEKQYTTRILKNLMIIEREKLYCDLKYSSLHKYIIKELNYSEAEATVRVNAVRLMLKSKSAQEKINSGEMTLTNAAEVNKTLNSLPKELTSSNPKNDKTIAQKQKELINLLVQKASTKSTRQFKEYVSKTFDKERREILVLKEYMIVKFDRLRKKYGDLSTLELLEILIERDSHIRVDTSSTANVAKQRGRQCENKNSRYIPKSVKLAVYEGFCRNCGVMYGLEYDHKLKFSHGGDNSSENIQMLCKSCNLRKEIMAQKMGVFL